VETGLVAEFYFLKNHERRANYRRKKQSTLSLVEGSIFFPAVDEEQEAWKVI